MDILNLNLPSPPLSNSQSLFSHQQVRPPKIKPIFPKTVLWRSQMPSSITKHRQKGLSSIQLLCSRSDETNPGSLRTILKSLKETKRLLSLTIVEPLNPKEPPHFLNATSRLKRLTVDFDYLTDGEDINKKFEEMLTRFRRLRYLSDLDISFDTSDEITNRILVRLLKQLKTLTKFRNLNLDVVGLDDKDESLKVDYEPNVGVLTSQYPRSLRSLCVKFQASDLPHIRMYQKFASNLSRCHSLEYLSLDCSGLFSILFNFLAPIFRMTQSLKTLCITRKFSLPEEIYESQQFVTSFEYLKHLTELELRISMDFPEDQSKKFVKSLFMHLFSMTNLESLKLELSIKEIPSDDDPDFQEILLSLKSLSRLQTLDLSLHYRADAKMTYLQSLFQAFQSFSCLRNFRLNLPPEHKISHENIAALSLMLKNNCLKTLNLVFNDTEVGSDALESLFANIAHFQLSSLLLDVRQKGPLCLVNSKETIGKDATAIDLLFSALSNFTFLSSLDLNLTSMDFPVTNLEELSLALKNLKHLTYLSLNSFTAARSGNDAP